MRFTVQRILAALAALFGLAVPTAMAGPPAGFTTVTLATGLDQPVAHAYSPDGRLFIAEKAGRIFVQPAVEGSARTLFLDLRTRVNAYGERGLTGLALDPNFATTGRLYLLYTREPDPQTPDGASPSTAEIARVTTSIADVNLADPATLVVVAEGSVVDNCCHAVGALRFDGQGRLLASFGDANTLTYRAQSIDEPAGKILRIDPTTGYGVPGNPYYDALHPATVRSRVLARGLRNPFRFQPDPVTGDVWVGDVGQSAWEELDRIPAVAATPAVELNFGWPCYEGGNGIPLVYPGALAEQPTLNACQATFTPAEGGSGLGSAPSHVAYSHDDLPDGAAIVGGPVYRGLLYPAGYRGTVFVADYAVDRFQYLVPGMGLVDFGTDSGWGNPVDIIAAPSGNPAAPAGNLSYAAIGTGEIRQIVWLGGNSVPVVSVSSNATNGAVPLIVQVQATVHDADPADIPTLLWNFGDGSPTVASANATHTYSAPGSYTATFVANDGHPGGRVAKTIRIDVGNTAPTVSTSSSQITFAVGDTITYTVNAVDPEDGPLTGASITTHIQRVHLGHTHPISDVVGATGSVVASDHGDDPGRIEITATATDRFGLSTVSTIKIEPRRVPVTVTSTPPGAGFVLDSSQFTTPHVVQSVVGGHHVVLAASRLGDQIFKSWSVNSVQSNAPSLTFQTGAAPAAFAIAYGPEVVPPPATSLTEPPAPVIPVAGVATSLAGTVLARTIPSPLSGRATRTARSVRVSLISTRRGRLTIAVRRDGRRLYTCRALVGRVGQRTKCEAATATKGRSFTVTAVLRDLKRQRFELRVPVSR